MSAGHEIFRDAVRGKRFAVRARYVGDREGSSFGSKDVETELGEALRALASRVDLDDPEVTAHVEIHRGQAYFFASRRPGQGGLPVGCGDRAVALVSGGFDSAVAAWQLLKRGVTLDYVFCNLGGASHRLGALRVMKVIADRWSYGSQPRLHAVDFEGVSRELQHEHDAPLLAGAPEALDAALGRGDRPTTAAAAPSSPARPWDRSPPRLSGIWRPSARRPPCRSSAPWPASTRTRSSRWPNRIGTGPLSAVVAEYCAMVPRRPSTSAKLDVILEEESRIDPAVLETAIANREVLNLRALDPDDTGLEELESSEIPDGASRDRSAQQGGIPLLALPRRASGSTSATPWRPILPSPEIAPTCSTASSDSRAPTSQSSWCARVCAPATSAAEPAPSAATPNRWNRRSAEGPSPDLQARRTPRRFCEPEPRSVKRPGRRMAALRSARLGLEKKEAPARCGPGPYRVAAWISLSR